MSTLIQVRRDTQANWTSNDPVLASGEIAFSTDQDKIKIGDGSSSWSELIYINSLPSEITAEINSAVSGIVDGAPDLLNTLNELAQAINDDESFHTTVDSAIASAVNAIDTDDIEEGSSNLYFTESRAQEATPGRVTASATIPSSPSVGDGWLDLEDGALYIYLNDGDTSQWVQA